MSREPRGHTLFLVTPTGEELQVVGEHFVIGRTEGCDFRPASSIISRRHAVILREGESYLIEDLSSASGTWINRQILHGRCPLREGDELRLADVELRVSFR